MFKRSFIALPLLVLAGPALADRFALIDAQGNIVNIIEAGSSFVPAQGFQLQPADNTFRIGGTFINDVYTAPAPPAAFAKSLSFLELMALFTPDEQTAIVSSTDTQVKLFMLMATGARAIYVTDPRTTQGFDLLVSKGLLTPEREAAILAGM